MSLEMSIILILLTDISFHRFTSKFLLKMKHLCRIHVLSRASLFVTISSMYTYLVRQLPTIHFSNKPCERVPNNFTWSGFNQMFVLFTKIRQFNQICLQYITSKGLYCYYLVLLDLGTLGVNKLNVS